MANVNGNNMDDLFRQASDQYPLRTNSSNWDRLSAALDANPSLVSPQGVEQTDKRRRRRVLWLLLLPLMAGGLGYYAWRMPAARKGGPGINYAKAVPAETGGTGSSNAEGTSAGTETKLTETNAQPGVRENSTGNNGTGMPGRPGAGIIKMKNGNNEAIAKNNPRENELRENGFRTAGGSKGGGSKAGGSNIAGSGVGRSDISGSNAEASNVGGSDIGGSDIGGSDAGIVAGLGKRVNTGGRQGAGNSHDLQYSKVNGQLTMVNRDITVPAVVRDRANGNGGQEQASTRSAAVKKNTMATRRHSIYVGLLGAPDLSTVEFQNVRSLGTTFGILGGYTLNNKWSLETGIYLDKKDYYTDGRYFNTEKIPALQNPYVNLKNVNGSCNMLEIPVNVRYNLSLGQTHTWFATAGLNTYLMYKENYQYKTVWNNTNPQTSPVYTYRTPYHYLFSIIDMSLGYEQKLGKIGNLRIEPYLRIPLSGIGTGNLSILSAGLNLGITRRIW